MINSYTIGWSQDHHHLNRRLKASKLRAALEYGFPDNENTGKLAMLFYGGDFWNHLAESVQSDEFQEACSYISWRCQSSAKQGYPIRILKGTNSHDYEQCRWWTVINDALDEPADLKYIDTVCIESHPVLGDILYVPDNWKSTADEVWEDVCAVLAAKNMEKVDWIIFHGAFKHQLPEHIHNKVSFLHDSNRYSSICRKYVLAGHVHLYSQWKNIISCGSLDRMSFGEEAPKGMLKITVNPNEADNILFIENPYARKMLTYSSGPDPDFEEVVAWLKSHTENMFDNYASFRLCVEKYSQVALNFKTLEEHFKGFEIVLQHPDSNAPQHQLIKLDTIIDADDDLDMSNDNLSKLLRDLIGDDLTPEVDAIVMELFK